MEKLQTKKEVSLLALLFTLTYMVSYITRINYSAVIVEMVTETGYGKPALSMALTGLFITYGTGQVISGICGDRISPKKLIAGGLGIATLMNLLIPLCQNPYQMTVVWCINGFAQALLWPPMVRTMTALLTERDYHYCVVRVSWGSSIGTILIYLVAPLLISLSGWRTIFLFSAACGALMLLVWLRYGYDVGAQPRRVMQQTDATADGAQARKGGIAMLFTPMMLCVMLAIVLQGMLRDGVTTWLPSYVSETYALDNEIAILTSVVLPLFSIACFQISDWLYRKKIQNPLLCAAFFFGVGAICSALLVCITGKSAAVSLLSAALLAGCMHGVNLMLISMIPPFFARYGNVSTASGVLNSCTYIGSAAFTYGVALLSERIGWTYTLLVWLGIAALGTALCLVCVRPWKKFEKGEEAV